MAFAIYPAVVFTVILLVTTAYFLMGGLPLLILKHDTALDARFIRGFFNVYYKAAFFAATCASISLAVLGRLDFAMGAAGLACTVVLLRKKLIPAMEHIGVQIHADDTVAAAATATPMPDQSTLAIQKFRRVHAVALLINLAQLALLVWALTKFAR
jgi:hypothetical protein